METNELYLKTAFCCMACDGDIASEELELIKIFASNSDLFLNLDIESKLNEYVADINLRGMSFLSAYLKDISNADLTESQELNLVEIAIRMIEADNKVEYSEISFFKKIRSYLRISDNAILGKLPNKEDYLLPDIIQRNYEFVLDSAFTTIDLKI